MSLLVRFTDALRMAFGPAKVLAAVAGVHLDTAYRYQAGETVPDALALIRLMSRSRELTYAVLRLANMEDIQADMEIARLARLLAELEQKRAERNDALAAAMGTDTHTGAQLALFAHRGRARSAELEALGEATPSPGVLKP